MTDSLAVVADCSPKAGLGHFMRGVAVVEAWLEAGGHATIYAVGANHAGSLPAAPEGTGVVVGRPPTAEMLAESATVAIIDGYRFPKRYSEALMGFGLFVVVYDDDGRFEAPAHMIVNQSIGGVTHGSSEVVGAGGIAADPAYAAIRGVVRAVRRAPPGRTRRVIVTLGWAPDPETVSTVVEGLQRIDPPVEIRAFSSEAAGSVSAVARPPEQLLEGLAWADLAVCSGGVTSLECAHVGLPMVLLPTAANQKLNVRGFEREGVARVAADVDHVRPLVTELLGRPDQLEQMGRRGRELIDGRGAQRVVALIRSGIGAGTEGPSLDLRPASDMDVRLFWELRNEPLARSMSRDQAPIDGSSHERWFKAALGDESRLLLVVESPIAPLGTMRFDRSDREARVSIQVARFARGKRLCEAMLDLGMERAAKMWPDLRTFSAEIHRRNVPSQRCFERVGFVVTDSVDQEFLLLTMPNERGVR